MRQAFGNSGFTYAGLADNYRIILCSAAQNLDKAFNLLIPADNRINFATAGLQIQITSVAGKNLQNVSLFFFCLTTLLISSRYSLALIIQRLHQLLDSSQRNLEFLQYLISNAVTCSQKTDKQLLTANVFLLQLLCVLCRALHYTLRALAVLRQLGLLAAFIQPALQLRFHLVKIIMQFVQQLFAGTILYRQKAPQNMLRTYMLAAAVQGLGGSQLQHLGRSLAEALAGNFFLGLTSGAPQHFIQKTFGSLRCQRHIAHAHRQVILGAVTAKPFINLLITYQAHHVHDSLFFMTIFTKHFFTSVRCCAANLQPAAIFPSSYPHWRR